TLKKSKFGASAFVSYVYDQQRNNHTDYLHCLFACFLSQLEPSSVAQALIDPAWVEAMQEEMQQFINQKVWQLVPLPDGNIAIGTKWILKNKRDTKGIVVRNKAKLVAQGHRQEDGIDYDESCESFVWSSSSTKGLVYVDGIIFGSTNQTWCDEFEVLMKGEFEMSAMAFKADIKFAVTAFSRHQWYYWFLLAAQFLLVVLLVSAGSVVPAAQQDWILGETQREYRLLSVLSQAGIKTYSTRRNSLATRKMSSSEVDLTAPDQSFIQVLSHDDSDVSDDDSDPLFFWHVFAAWEVVPTGLGDVNALYFTDKTSKYFTHLREI
ncbi:putative ribonuclease H-like domain-containing protein, partial [Tanacetum coccineum]